MKERIYTIPINEVFEKECECPLCLFEKDEEQKLLDYTLGASMMEPDARQITNEKGFCKHHYLKLMDMTEKLPLALVTETHMDEILKDLKEFDEKLPKLTKKVFKKSGALKEEIKKQTDFFDKLNKKCAICERHNHIMDVFMKNLIFLIKTEPDFYKKFFASKGFCLKHFNEILKYALDDLDGQFLYDFVKALYKLEIENFARVDEDVKWFTKKFDYRYKDEPWKNSKDAVKRSTEKIVSYSYKDE